MDSDTHFALKLASHLERTGFACLTLDGAARPSDIARSGPDVILLGSEIAGRTLAVTCGVLRDAGYRGGLIVLTRDASELDVVRNLDAGADDLVDKRVAAVELVARVRSLVRLLERQRSRAKHVLLGQSELIVDPVRGTAVFDGATLPLGPRQLEVLIRLLRRRGEVASREHLMPGHFSAKALDVTVRRLRTNLADAGVPLSIVNVRGLGFTLSDRGASGRLTTSSQPVPAPPRGTQGDLAG